MTINGRKAADLSRVPIGRRVAILRVQRRMSQPVLAGLVGRSKSWLDKIERGVRPLEKLPLIHHLAAVLNVNPRLLTEGIATPGCPRAPRHADRRGDARGRPASGCAITGDRHHQPPHGQQRKVIMVLGQTPDPSPTQTWLSRWVEFLDATLPALFAVVVIAVGLLIMIRRGNKKKGIAGGIRAALVFAVGAGLTYLLLTNIPAVAALLRGELPPTGR